MPVHALAPEVAEVRAEVGLDEVVVNYDLVGVYDFDVPTGVTSVHVVLAGASGVAGAGTGTGGAGGVVEGDIDVTPGETLRVTVGGQAEGQNGGGLAGSYGGHGGGATDIRRGAYALADRIAVAGGGGGGGNNTIGGAAGSPNGAAGQNTSFGDGGAGGTQAAGGAPGGALGEGGDATGGGGGGGGYYGGGSGVAGVGGGNPRSAGGGGSCLVPVGCVFVGATNVGIGLASITYTPPTVSTRVAALEASGSGGGGGGVLARVTHDPAVAETYNATTTSADADADLAITFDVPASGEVLVTLNAMVDVAANNNHFWSLREGAADVDEVGIAYAGSATGATSPLLEYRATAIFHLTGLTPGETKTYKWGLRKTTGTALSAFYAGGVYGAALMTVEDGVANGEVPGAGLVYTWNPATSNYDLTGGRTFIGPTDPTTEGFVLVDGDQWEQTA